MKYDVFISYSSQDQKVVEGICGYLETRGIRCFVAYRDIPRGVVWARAIVEALDKSRMMVVAFSDSFNASEQVEREIELASEDHKPILTFRLSDSKFEGAKKYYLKNLNWIDAFPNPDDAFGDLYQNVCRLLEIDTNAPEDSNQNSSHTAPITSTTQAEENTHTNVINGHKYVDLGLPSGLKWAVCNVGATRKEEYGDYFAWGEISQKKTYTEENSETLGKDDRWLFVHEFVDDFYNLELCHDAACKRWGGSWRMPTLEEIEELLKNTTTKFTSINGVKGRVFKSKINGQRLFVPASGIKGEDTIYANEKFGNFWSSNPNLKDNNEAFHLSFNSQDIAAITSNRDLGLAIRPVSE